MRFSGDWVRPSLRRDGLGKTATATQQPRSEGTTLADWPMACGPVPAGGTGQACSPWCRVAGWPGWGMWGVRRVAFGGDPAQEIQVPTASGGVFQTCFMFLLFVSCHAHSLALGTSLRYASKSRCAQRAARKVP